MSRHLLFVFTRALEGRDAEFNEWYDTVHLDDVLALDGFVSGQRFALADVGRPQKSPYRYVAVYEIEGDPEAARRALSEATRGDDALELSPALDLSDIAMWYFTPVTERRDKTA